MRTQNASYRSEESRRLIQAVGSDECVICRRAPENLKSAKWSLAIDLSLCTHRLESTIHAVERVGSQGRGEPTRFIPIRFIHTDKLTSDDTLLLSFDALVLSEILGREVGLGKIVHGDKSVTHEVKTGALASQVRKLALVAGKFQRSAKLETHKNLR